MRLDKISPAQKKIILEVAVALAAFLLFLLLAYLPSRKTVKTMTSELENAERQIQQIEAMLGSARSMDEGIQLLNKRFQQLDSKFSLGEEDSVRLLSEMARKLNVDLISIKPQRKTSFVDENNQAITVAGKSCQRILISLEMRCSYKDLVKYIRYLRESYPVLAGIERLRITKDQSGPLKLNVSFDAEIYLFN
ncbi:MAG: hypothetical protein WCL25_03995 [bacterium]